jgi:negative regulator of replication initiation
MRKIDIDEDVYRYLVSHTRDFGETPSDVLRRLLGLLPAPAEEAPVEASRAQQAPSQAAGPAEPPPPPPPAAKPPPTPPASPPKPPAPNQSLPAPSPKSDQPAQNAPAPSQPPTAPAPKPPPPTPKPADPPPRPPAPAKAAEPGPAKEPAPKSATAPKPAPEPDVADPKQALIAFLSSPKVKDANATTRYLEILGYLSEERPRDFEGVLDMGGRTRRYFARSKREIEESGKSTAPREIPGAKYWAMTGVDTFQKRDILRQAMEKMKYDPDSIDRCVEAVK